MTRRRFIESRFHCGLSSNTGSVNWRLNTGGEERCRRGRVGQGRGEKVGLTHPPVEPGETELSLTPDNARPHAAQGGVTLEPGSRGEPGADFLLLLAGLSFCRQIFAWSKLHVKAEITLHGTRSLYT